MNRDWTERIENVILGSNAIRGLANLAQKIMNALFMSGPLHPLKSLLNGKWLEHPLHPLLTDVPVGAWTAAVLLDLIALLFHLSGLGLAGAIINGLGILAALAAIAAGFMDWMDVDPPELSIGITHAAINIVATILFVVSFALSWANGWEMRWRIFLPAIAGYLIIAFGAYLGGSLVFRRGVMINRNAYRSGPKNFIPVLPAQDLAENTPKRVDAKGRPVLLVRQGDQVYAVGAVCSHYGAPLESGSLKEGTIVCPWHSSRYALKDGHVVSGPSTCGLPAYETRVKDGNIELKAK